MYISLQQSKPLHLRLWWQVVEMVQPMRTAVLGLYRELRREGARLMDYNYRDYALRRARKGFEMARGFPPEEAEVAYEKGKQQLEVVRRQATISQLYPHQASVMETKAYTPE